MMKRVFAHSVSLAVLCLPFVAGAAIVPNCEGPNCNFDHFILLARNVINFIVFISVPVFGGIFVWSGFLMLSATVKPAQKENAKALLSRGFVGFLWVIGSFVVVRLVVVVLLGDKAQEDVGRFIHI